MKRKDRIKRETNYLPLLPLGNGDLNSDGCQQEKNWQTLNRCPTRCGSLQAQAQRIDEDDGILSGRK